MEEDEALPLLKYAFDKGINTWDTVSAAHMIFARSTDS